MEDRRAELRAIVEQDQVHCDQAALILFYTQDTTNEDLLCIIRHVPFLTQSAWRILSQRNPSEDEVKQAILEEAVRSEARKLLLFLYPTQENLALLLYGGEDRISEQAGEMLLRDHSHLSNQLLVSIIKFTKELILRERASTELLARSNVPIEELEWIITRGPHTQAAGERILRSSPTAEQLLRLFRSDFPDRTRVWGSLSGVLSALDNESLWGLFKDFPANRPVVWEYLRGRGSIRYVLLRILDTSQIYGEPYVTQAAARLRQIDPSLVA